MRTICFPLTPPLAFTSSTAILAPLRRSTPTEAASPVRGPMKPTLIVSVVEEAWQAVRRIVARERRANARFMEEWGKFFARIGIHAEKTTLDPLPAGEDLGEGSIYPAPSPSPQGRGNYVVGSAPK